MSITWNIWKHRNKVIFKSRKYDVLQVLAVTQVNMCVFIVNKHGNSRISFSDWCIDPLTCLKLLD